MIVNNNGVAAPAFMAQAQPLSPSFFVFDAQHVVGVHANGPTQDVGPATLYPGLTSPAKPGETVMLYANGFGPTSDPVASGSPSQSGSLAVLPIVTIGGLPATVKYAGLISPGLYQLNVIVPTGLSDGDQPITAT